MFLHKKQNFAPASASHFPMTHRVKEMNGPYRFHLEMRDDLDA